MSISKKTMKLSEFIRLLRIMQELESKQTVEAFIGKYMFSDNYAYFKEEEKSNDISDR